MIWKIVKTLFVCALLVSVCHAEILAKSSSKSKLSVGDLIKALGASKQANGFSELANYLEEFPDLLELLTTEENITFFAPTNQAIKNRGALTSSLLHDIIKYHVVLGDVGNYKSAPVVNVVNTSLNAGSSQLVQLPNGTHQKLIVLNDKGLRLAILYGSNVPALTLQDAFECANGKVFPINTLLLPPINPVVTASVFGLSLFMDSLTKAAIQQEYVSAKGVTLFIPKTEILQDYLLRHPKIRAEQLAFLLRHHAVRQPLYSNLIDDGMTVESDAKLDLKFEKTDGIHITVNGISIVTPNIITSNGVMHIIDGLLNPFKQVSKHKPSVEVSHETDAPATKVDDDEEDKTVRKQIVDDNNEKRDPNKIRKDIVDDEDNEGDRVKQRIVADAPSDVIMAKTASTCALFSIIVVGVLGLYL